MQLETILDAMEDAIRRRTVDDHFGDFDERLRRQYRAFRARILRMDAEKDKRIAELERELEAEHDWTQI